MSVNWFLILSIRSCTDLYRVKLLDDIAAFEVSTNKKG